MPDELNEALDRTVIRATLDDVRQQLLAERSSAGHWVGRLSSSALATATAISALTMHRQNSSDPVAGSQRLDSIIGSGINWLSKQQNPDGGWGDTPESHSNISTSMLVVAAAHLCNQTDRFSPCLSPAEQYIERQGHVDGLKKRYGIDKTFAVPILANCAMAGRVPWSQVAALPCEAAIVPQRLYRWLSLPVVSYAIPALVGIGQAKLFADPPRNPVVRWVRKLSVNRGLSVLEKMQPASGGYLEAIPLTSFVVMSLCFCGRADHQVVRNGIRFLLESFRQESDQGAWPIDTNLATWNTTLAINALYSPDRREPNGRDQAVLSDELLQWLLDCQNKTTHPFTGARPGGWGWSDLSGAVPDADDTPGALLALRRWAWHENPADTRVLQAAGSGISWLLQLQNRDFGWPTFCRGWGKLPFDRSGADITAHVLRALWAWRADVEFPSLLRAISRGFDYLARVQRPDGSWDPLWFGNQDVADESNRVYGTSKVLLAFRDAERFDTPEATRGLSWLVDNQNPDGGWGGGPSCHSLPDGTSSLQETALVLEAMAHDVDEARIISARERGVRWLVRAIKAGKTGENWPIGFYFAKLWYYESLYPLVFSASALRSIVEMMDRQAGEGGKTSQSVATRQANSRGISIGG